MTRTYNAVIGERARNILLCEAQLSVIAVHSESVYARCSDGRLFLLCSDKYGSVPFGVSVHEYARFRKSHAFYIGDVIRVESGVLVCSDGARISFAVESEAVERAHTHTVANGSVVNRCAQYIRDNASARGIGPALPAFLCIGTPRDTSNVYALSAAGEADRFEAALGRGDAESLDSAVGRFVGLGYGLTPSGDDFLCGMLYAFHRFSAISEKSVKYLKMCSDAVRVHITQTNEVSAEYLRCALDGEYFEVIERVLDCLSSNQDKNIHKLDSALSELLSVGASSGSDIMCGILFAIYLLW